MTPQDQYKLLLESLRLVAAPASEQLAAVPDFVSVTDEVSTTFGDAVLLLPQLERSGRVSPAGGDAIRRLDAWFDAMPTDGSIADPSSLERHEFWAHARQLAADALGVLGECVLPLAVDGTRWVKGS